ALAKLVVSDGQAAGVTDRFDFPGDPRGSLTLYILAPQCPHALDQPARRVDLEVLALSQEPAIVRAGHLVARPGREVRAELGAELVLASHLRVGDRLPQPLGSGLDVNLEYLFHASFLQLIFEAAQCRGPRLGVLAHPPVVDKPDWNRVQNMELLA